MPKQLRAHTPVNQVPIQPSITSVAPTPTPQPVQPVKFSGRVNEFENDHFVVSERQERDVDDRSLYRTVHVPESRGAVSPIRNTLWGTCVLKLVSQQQAFTPHVQEVPQQPQHQSKPSCQVPLPNLWRATKGCATSSLARRPALRRWSQDPRKNQLSWMMAQPPNGLKTLNQKYRAPIGRDRRSSNPSSYWRKSTSYSLKTRTSGLL